MTRKIVYAVLVMMLCGCASFSESQGIVTKGQVRSVQVLDFDSTDPATGKLFKEIISEKLSAADFVLTNENPDAIITGIVTKNRGNFSSGEWIDWVWITAKKNEKIIASVQFNPQSLMATKTPVSLASEIAERLCKKLKGE